MKPYVFGIDVGGTSVKFGLFENGTLKEKWEMPTNAIEGGRYMVSSISDSLKTKMDKYGLDANVIKGAGMGVPGAVQTDGYLEPCVNLNGWGGAGLEAEFKNACGFPVFLINDANAAGLGELREGGGKGFRDMYFVTLGTGVGGCLILNKRLITGAHGCAGEIGHIHVKDNEESCCGCGRKGCLEQYASATGIVRMAKKQLNISSCESGLRKITDITCRDIFDLAKAGDSLCLSVAEEMTGILGKALAGIACTCNPEVIVIGGGVSKAGDLLLEGLRKTFKDYAFASSVNTKIVLAKLGNDAGIYGGLELVEEKLG